MKEKHKLMDFDLNEKCAVIVGGAGGIGKTIAEAFSEKGVYTAIVDYNYMSAKKVSESINLKSKSKAYKADIKNRSEVIDCTKKIVQDFGKIDILVNSAGINYREPLIDIVEEHWDEVIAVNLKGTFLFSQAVAKEMLKTGGGKIINIASISSILGHPSRSAYAASKGGVVQLTKVMAIELAEHNILVNAISPAAIDTPFVNGYMDTAEKQANVISRFPLKRIGVPEDLIGAVIFLSSAASDFVTGINLVIDGGRTID